MKDTRTVLDAVRTKIPPNAKLLILWQRAEGGPMVAAQANLNQNDISEFGLSFQVNSMTEKSPKPRRN